MIYYVRHGETVWNRAGRLQGRLDSPLTERGVAFAKGYGRTLSRSIGATDAVRMFASPLGRAHTTAIMIADALGLDASAVRIDPLLAEHDVGAWAGRTWDEIEREDGATPERLRDWHYRPPGGETRAEMLERARSWLAARDPSATDIVVSHGGMSRAFRAAYLDLTLEAALELPTHRHGRFYRLCGGAIRSPSSCWARG